jgi:hypothetical protein
VKETPTQSAHTPTIADLCSSPSFTFPSLLFLPSRRRGIITHRCWNPQLPPSNSDPQPTKLQKSCREAVGRHPSLSCLMPALLSPFQGWPFNYQKRLSMSGDPSLSARCVVERSDLRAAILSLLRFPNLGFLRSRRHPHALRNMGLGAIIFCSLSPNVK